MRGKNKATPVMQVIHEGFLYKKKIHVLLKIIPKT